MKFNVLEIAGLRPALYGLGLSYGKTKSEQLGDVEKIMSERANSNANLGFGHNKFLESIQVWIELTAPRFFWSEFDTYRLMTKQSDSTMHTLLKDCKDRNETIDKLWDALPRLDDDGLEELIQDYFGMYAEILERIKTKKHEERIHIAKCLLPECWEQTRVICVSYKTLQNIYAQRNYHLLPEWRRFCEHLKDLPNSEWIIKEE